MIDYSVYMQPNNMQPSEPPKAYAKAQIREVMTFAKFIAHVSEHGATYSRGTVRGVISDVCKCIVEQLLEGKKIEMGELGYFWIALRSEGTDTMAEFTSRNIKEVNIIFTPGEDFANIVNMADFNLVASRAVQAATIKALKANEDTVDLSATRSSSSSGGSSSGSPDTGNTGSDKDDGSLEA